MTRSIVFAMATVALASLSQAQTFTFTAIDDTILLSNGTPFTNNTGDNEDNFGGRTELIGNANSNANNVRDMLLRFDVSAAAAAINDPGLSVVDATLSLNPREERLSNNQGASDAVLGVYGLRPENEGWVEGTRGGSGPGRTGELGTVSRLFRSTPSNFSVDEEGNPIDPAAADDGLFWLSSGGGATTDDFPSAFSIAEDTTNRLLGSADTALMTDAILAADLDFDIPLGALGGGYFVNQVVEDWLAAPLMDDGDGGMQTSAAGLIVSRLSGDASQWFFESLEGRPEEAATLTITFGVAGDVNGDGFNTLADFDIIAQNFGQELTDVSQGDLLDDDIIDWGDYRIWKDSFVGAPPSSSIPEPTTLLLAAGLASAGLARRR